jgi:Rrf2 family protein
MRISKKSQYGLRAMIYLANFSKKKKLCCLKKISQREGIPFSFLEKIFSRLVKEGLVGAKKGVAGGYFLAKRPEDIKIGQIVRILEKETAPVKCLEKEAEFKCPKEKNCSARKLWQRVKKSLDRTLDSITLADLLR